MGLQSNHGQIGGHRVTISPTISAIAQGNAAAIAQAYNVLELAALWG
jgi:hypothetical protein